MTSEEFRAAYVQKLKDPRWQKRRLQILSRDNFMCIQCSNTEECLNVHHRWYERGQEPWDASDDQLCTLCETCHEAERANRPDMEAALLKFLRKRFLSAELFQVAKLLDCIALGSPLEVELTALAWKFGSRVCVEDAIQEFSSDPSNRTIPHLLKPQDFYPGLEAKA
jgi:hypothetical protein